MDSSDLSLNPSWRDRIAQVGRTNFVREEMLRLGFLGDDLVESELSRIKGFLDEAYPRLTELRRDLSRISKEIRTIGDLDSILLEIRTKRIERVRRELEQRRARKEEDQLRRSQALELEQRKAPGFLGRGVSARLSFHGGNPSSLAQAGIPAPGNVEELASLMEIDPGEILWLSYERGASSVDHYTRFEIPKKSGGRRLISAPKSKLRAAQSWILTHILDRLSPSSNATAFRRGASILDNARAHMHAAVVVKLDLQDFFPSITFPRVRGYFEHLGFNPGIASVLGLICTDASRVKLTLDGTVRYVAMGGRSLPQGACTSPALANLIATPMDARIVRLCASLEAGWIYTRYADDLTFSSRNADADVGRLLGALRKIAPDEGFQINEQKTAVMRRPGRQVVTGLLIGDRIRLSRKDLRRLRAFLHRCDVEGLESVSQRIGKDALSVARGHLSYVGMVMPDCADKIRERHPWL